LAIAARFGDDVKIELLVPTGHSSGYAALQVMAPPARDSSCRIDLLGADYVSDQQISAPRKKAFVRAGGPKAEVFFVGNLHGISLREAAT
jgi:hypothetical protein